MAYCSNCGNKLSEIDKFCENCGIKTTNLKSDNIAIVAKPIEKKFNHKNYIIILTLSILIGVAIHIHFMEGSGKYHLQYLIDKYGSIGFIPIEDALLYDFHFTWITYTSPQILLICLIWYFHYQKYKSDVEIKKWEKSPIKTKDGAGLR